MYVVHPVPSPASFLYFLRFEILPQCSLRAHPPSCSKPSLLLSSFEDIMPLFRKGRLSTHNQLPPLFRHDSFPPSGQPHSPSSFLAHKGFQIAPVGGPSHPKAFLQLPSPKEMHTLLLSLLQRSSFLPTPPPPHTKPQYLHRHLSSCFRRFLTALPLTVLVRDPLLHNSPKTHALPFSKKESQISLRP